MLMDHATATLEINQLLGDSSDDDDEGNVPLDDNQELSAEEVDELPEGHNSHSNKDELHDLLGDSDDEGDAPTTTRESYDNTSGKILIDEQPLIATIRSVNDLDDILGARDADEVTKSPTKDTKDRSVSKMVLPYTYKSKAGDSSIFVRTPNFIKIQSAEYSRLSYNPDQERQFFDGATAVIRWRLKRDADGEVVCDADGIPVKESNARMVEWSDGSMQLVVGDAVFQCKGLSLDNCYSYAQQKASMLSSSETVSDQTPAAVSDCLECVGTISQRYMLQPSSLDSEIHARMSMKISERSKKDRRTRDRDYEDITEKPEITLAALARKEEEEMRRERRAKEVSEYRSGGASQLYGRRPSMSAEYLAGRDDDEFDGDNLAALKRSDYEKKPKPSSAQKRKYYEEEVEDDDEEEEEQEMIGDGFEEEDEVTGSGRSWEQSSSKKAKSRDDVSTLRSSTEKASKVKKPLKGSDEAVLNSTVDKDSDDDNDLMVQRKRLSRAIIDSDDDEV